MLCTGITVLDKEPFRVIGFLKQRGLPTMTIAKVLFPLLLLVFLTMSIPVVAQADPFVELRKAAEQGDAEAQFSLGFMYTGGLGVPQDDAQAITWYRKAADQELADAQFYLGLMYDEGRGVPQDFVKAYKWYRKAAEQGLVVAQYNLYFMYREGQGVSQDYAQAIKWCSKAAEQGLAEAQYNLGGMYEKGQGVPQDYIEAYKWWNLSAAQGEPVSAKNRDILSTIMTPEQIAEGRRLSREWKPKQ